MAILLLVGGVFAFTQVKTWKIGKDYNVDFSAKGVNGIFKTLTGTVQFDEAKLSESKFVFTIDVNSINTGNGLQNRQQFVLGGLQYDHVFLCFWGSQFGIWEPLDFR